MVETVQGEQATALILKLKERGAIVAETNSAVGPPPNILLVVQMPNDQAAHDECAKLLRTAAEA
jgi:hypothetical protein